MKRPLPPRYIVERSTPGRRQAGEYLADVRPDDQFDDAPHFVFDINRYLFDRAKLIQRPDLDRNEAVEVLNAAAVREATPQWWRARNVLPQRLSIEVKETKRHNGRSVSRIYLWQLRPDMAGTPYDGFVIDLIQARPLRPWGRCLFVCPAGHDRLYGFDLSLPDGHDRNLSPQVEETILAELTHFVHCWRRENCSDGAKISPFSALAAK